LQGLYEPPSSTARPASLLRPRRPAKSSVSSLLLDGQLGAESRQAPSRSRAAHHLLPLLCLLWSADAWRLASPLPTPDTPAPTLQHQPPPSLSCFPDAKRRHRRRDGWMGLL